MRWVHCCGCVLSVLRFVGSDGDCLFVCTNEEVEHEKDLPTLLQPLEVEPIAEPAPSLFVLCHQN